MKKQNGQYVYSPHDLILFMESEFASWMDRYCLEFPRDCAPDDEDEALVLLQAMGEEHEKAYLSKLIDSGRDVWDIRKQVGDPHSETIEAMRSGKDVIYQAALRSGNFAGYADFLIREPRTSTFGDYGYQVWDTKLALNPKPYFLIQLCCYAEMLEAIQGRRPQSVGIILGNGEPKSFRTDDYFYCYLQLKEAFLEKERLFDPTKRPDVSKFEECRRWNGFAKKLLEESDHLSAVANIMKVQVKKLARVGITTMNALASTELQHVKDMEPSTLDTLRQQARLQVQSASLRKPLYELITQNQADPRRGLALLPPLSAMDVYFDMEGYPHVEGGLEYLFGVSYLEHGELQFSDWWAHSRDEESKTFREFIDWIHTRWKKDPTMHVYHYGNYEVTKMCALMGRHGICEREVDELLRSDAFVDLYTIVRQGLRVGEPRYSIKNIEHLYMEARVGDVGTAMESVVQYQKWLACPDGDTWKNSKILADIRAYNKDDCDSTAKLTHWLRDVQKDAGITWIPKAPKPESEIKQAIARNAAAELAERLLADLPEDGEQRALQEMLAFLLEFHWREAKPVFWAKYDRHEMTEDQLVDDINCLGALQRTQRPKEKIKRSFLYEYDFNPLQDTKLAPGMRCFFAHDLTMNCKIVELDAVKGRLTITLGQTMPEPPIQLSLIPDEYVSAEKIAQSIFQTVSTWKESDSRLPQAIEDFLLRKRPRIKGNPAGPIIANPDDALREAIKAVVNLDSSTLCVQGPPGAGKTFTAAATILALLQLGKRVGVTSNTHKAIANLMDEVARQAQQQAFSYLGVKIQSNIEDFFIEVGNNIAPSEKVGEVFAADAPGFQLIGGTAWAFSDNSAVGKLDYLFVDEAGQVSVANLVGMCRSSTNIVLVGDQMQLDQPILGAHPGDSGMSTLQFLLREHQTIPQDFGIFLGTTWRMHPEICDFISGAVYEDRLRAEKHTENRILILPSSGAARVTKTAGILYVPVDHDSNAQASDEEAQVVSELIAELQKCSLQEKDGKTQRSICLDDILIVAPYNMQVRKISNLIPAARVGSVDKFQGLGAPIVIVSMGASRGDSSARGIEFLFSKNRLNVAISRAQTLAIIVSNPALARTQCTKIQDMELVNMFCRSKQKGERTSHRVPVEVS